jgi:hypothetical protein
LRVTEHRASERGFFDKLQLPECQEARELLERLIENPKNTYEQICVVLNSSPLFQTIKEVRPQDLTRYRQRKDRAQSRAGVMALIESESETLLTAATNNPTGLIAKYLRKMLAEHAVERFDAEIETVGVVDVSREAARHALVAQRDRKLDLDEGKIELERKRIELQERRAELERDRFGIAADTWQFILAWCSREESAIADVLARRSNELLSDLEDWIADAG